jgi:membrane-associated protease RseP (regulator of RpoE activity)
MRRTSNITAVAVAFVSLMVQVPALAETGREKSEEVVFTGWLRVEDRNVDDLVLVVETAESCLYAEVLPSGRFIVAVPVGSEARLAFIKPGHITKEIELDTRNSMSNRKAARANSKVKFDVVLEPESKRPGRAYDGPVGSLAFNKGTSSTKVRHTLNVVAAEKKQAAP